MTARPYILVVDDDTRLRELLRRYLSDNGFRVTTASGAAMARKKLASLAFDLIVLDVMMPGESGLELASALRRTNSVPILMLTAMGEPEHRIDGLERGVDDYLPKPFEPRELLLRIRTILRRAPPPEEAPTEITFGPCRFDLRREVLHRSDVPVRLTAAEVQLLKQLARSPGVALSREDLSQGGGPEANARAVDVQVTRLRRKIEENPKMPRYLRTVRGKGYVLWPD